MSFKESSSVYLVTRPSLDWDNVADFFENGNLPPVPESIRAGNYQSYFNLEGSEYLVK